MYHRICHAIKKYFIPSLYLYNISISMKYLVLIMFLSNSIRPFLQTHKYFGLGLRLHTSKLTVVYSLLVISFDCGYFILNLLQRPEHGGLREWIFVCQNMFYASVCFFSHVSFLINSTAVNKYYLETLGILERLIILLIYYTHMYVCI